MGKSGKKNKTERINALRKQYDALVEEDKKRKQRNEYILERLDKMRYSNAVVPARNTSLGGWRNSDLGDNLRQAPRVPENVYQISRENTAVDIPIKFTNQSIILQEISKKYILIPKFRANKETNPVKNVEHDDNLDWRSKYDILDKLKQEEKEAGDKTIQNDLNFIQPVTATSIDTAHNAPAMVTQNDQYDHEISERDTTELLQDQIQYAPKQFIEAQEQYLTQANVNQDIVTEQTPNTEYLQPEHQVQVADSYYNNTSVHTNSTLEVNTISADPLIYNEGDQNYNNAEYDLQASYEHPETQPNAVYVEEVPQNEEQQENMNIQYDNENVITPESQDLVQSSEQENQQVFYEEPNVVQTIDPEVLVNEIKNVKVEEQNEAVTYAAGAMNLQEFPTNDNITQEGEINNPENNVQDQVDEIDTTAYQYEETPIVVEESINPDHTSGIEAFDAEQREMFYSEQPEGEYAYQEGQQQPGYGAEYPAQSENYPQNEAYVYYEGGAGDQSYPVEVNDSETAQQYDQSYEQQYQNYEQQYAQEQGQYQGELNQQSTYEPTQQEFEQINSQQEVETVENVKQQLDAEDGYVEQQSAENVAAVASIPAQKEVPLVPLVEQ